MRIKITVFGIFWSSELFNQLRETFNFTQLYTSFPKSQINVTSNKINTTNLEYLNFILRYFPASFRVNLNYLLRTFHYYLISNFLGGCDVIICWGYTSKYFINKAKISSKILILERGSTHPDFQKEILSEEYLEHGIHRAEFEYSNQLQKYEYEITDYIVVPSNFVKKTFIERGIPSEKIFVNPFGVDLKHFKKLDIKKEKFRIVFAGKACLRKGFHYLIEAMELLKNYEIELWHVGILDPEIKKFNYQKENIVYHGSHPQNELYKYYNHCNVFVLPSLEEGLALVTLQAMACGLPVICTPNTGIENVITKDGEEGFLIPIRDPGAIAEKVLELYKNKALGIKMGNAAAKRVASGFTWDDYGKRYIDFLNKISNE